MNKEKSDNIIESKEDLPEELVFGRYIKNLNPILAAKNTTGRHLTIVTDTGNSVCDPDDYIVIGRYDELYPVSKQYFGVYNHLDNDNYNEIFKCPDEECESNNVEIQKQPIETIRIHGEDKVHLNLQMKCHDCDNEFEAIFTLDEVVT